MEDLVAATARNYTYDANGNLLTDDYRDIDATVYMRGSYPHQVTQSSDHSYYLYDGGDQRISKKVVTSAQTTQEMYIKDALGRDLSIVKFTTTGSTTTSATEYFVHGTDRVARVTVSATTPLAKIQPDEATYFLYDHLGNTRVAFSVDGSNVPLIVNALDYYSYGKILREYDNGAGDRYLTTGHERDQRTGLDYRGARYYDSDIVRFLSLDPLANKYPAWSAYNYVMGNPVMLIDETGLAPSPPFRYEYLMSVGWTIYNHSKHVQGASTMGALLVMALATVESGWDGSTSNYNLFGIMAGGGEASNGVTAHGRVKDYTDLGGYKASIEDFYSKISRQWPDLLDVLKQEVITADDIDRAFHTGNYIPTKEEQRSGIYAYNYDFDVNGVNNYGTSILSQLESVKTRFIAAINYSAQIYEDGANESQRSRENYRSILTIETQTEMKVQERESRDKSRMLRKYAENLGK